jgi:hypothetical protein
VALKHYATASERTYARAFIAALGGSLTNPYLELAVVAWVHAEGKVLYNNPFNLRPYADDKPYRNGMRKQMKNGKLYGWLSTYANMTQGLLAAANRLKVLGGAGKYGYDVILKAARADRGGGKEAQQGVALDFLLAVAASSWAGGHYGLKANDVYTTSLYRAFAWFTGLAAIPASKGKPPKAAPKPKPLTPPPLYLAAPEIGHKFPDPYEAKRFLAGRRPPAIL